jgi:GDP-D-mannose 3', 5'-epimerase
VRTIVVCGAGGFIGGHLVADLLRQGGCRVRAVDIKPFGEWYQLFGTADNRQLDLRRRENCYEALEGANEVYNLAADMGGMGFIENNKAACMLSVLINTHLLEAARDLGIERYFYSSSACVYNQAKQDVTDVVPLREEDAYPAMPEDGYGWEKLFSERMCRHFAEDFGLHVRMARYHNVYGPHGTWDGGREKAPAAIIRKVIEAKHTGSGVIEIWGDGEQTRSFMYIDDCIHGTKMFMHGGVQEPLNLGSNELVTINGLVDMAEEIAGVKLERRYDLSAPKGVRGRNSDNTRIREAYGWEPSTRLRDGLERTYAWIHDEYMAREAARRSPVLRALPKLSPVLSAASRNGNGNGNGSHAPDPVLTILGAGGFIGSHLVEHLLERGGYRIIGVDVADDKLEGIEGSAFEFHKADVRKEKGLLEDVIRQADVVVDLVAHANPSLYVSSPLEVFELNFMLNLDVAGLCIRHGKRLIQYSSAEVYGKPTTDRGAFSENESDLVLGPVQKQRWIYSAGKSLLERVLYAHGVEGNLEYTIVRPFNFIGSRLDYLVAPGSMGGPRVFPHFMSALMGGGPLYLVDGGHVHRAFLHVDDASEAFQVLLDRREKSRNEIYNVGNPDNNLTIRELAILMRELYEEITGEESRSELVEVTGEEFYGEGYEDADRLVPDTRKLCSLGWRPRYDIRATFRGAMEEYLQHPERMAGLISPVVRTLRTGTGGR